jgi:hypothetical protein
LIKSLNATTEPPPPFFSPTDFTSIANEGSLQGHAQADIIDGFRKLNALKSLYPDTDPVLAASAEYLCFVSYLTDSSTTLTDLRKESLVALKSNPNALKQIQLPSQVTKILFLKAAALERALPLSPAADIDAPIKNNQPSTPKRRRLVIDFKDFKGIHLMSFFPSS